VAGFLCRIYERKIFKYFLESKIKHKAKGAKLKAKGQPAGASIKKQQMPNDKAVNVPEEATK